MGAMREKKIRGSITEDQHPTSKFQKKNRENRKEKMIKDVIQKIFFQF